MIGDRFFNSENIELVFQVPVEQAMQNLGAQVKAPANQTLRQEESLVGSVTQESTYLYRSVPGSRNSFRQTFYGSFSDTGSTSGLKGEITLNRVVKKFIVLWCSVVGLVAVVTLLTLLRNPAASWGSLIYVIVMLIVCVFFFRFVIKKTISDKDWLKEQIIRAVNER